MSGLPSGTVTFLFTDIEASTDLLQHLGDARYADVLAEHNRLLRAVFAEGGAEEVSTQGDAFLAIFRRAADAVAAAVAAQRAIVTHRWPGGAAPRVRMGVHTGEPLSIAANYVGLDVHRAARICTSGHGGQILLSQATRLLVEERLPPDVSLRDMGDHRLKGLHQIEKIFQVLHADLHAEFPPLRSLNISTHNLPRQLTSFIGREREIVDVRRLLSSTYLLTLTGSGGCGKTRLALEVAAGVLEEYTDGVWLVELASLSDPALVTQTVAMALGVREVPGLPLLSTLLDYLRSKVLLLVLDNCEHLVAACASMTETLLRTCPSLRVLATSRERLEIPGEVVWRVPSLSFPDVRRVPPVETLRQYEAIQLFVDRATAAQPDFALTPQNAPKVAAVCDRLDGIPLAIELAAARVQALSVEQIALRLNDRFQLLTEGSRRALPRQKTLNATMDWSYHLLSEPERALLCRLAAFAGGWTLEAAEAICQTGEDQTIDLLTQLVFKSLVIIDEQNGQMRYRFLATVRQYAWNRLAESGENPLVQKRHLDWFLRLAEETGPKLIGAGQAAWFGRLETEHDNLRAALEWSLESGEIEAGLRLAAAVSPFWFVRGYLAEGRRWLEALLKRSSGAEQVVRAKALRAAGRVAGFGQSDYDYGRLVYEESLAIWRELGDKRGIATVLGDLGVLAFGQADFVAARALYDESLAIWRELKDKWGVALSVHNLGRVAFREGDLETARILLEESLDIWRELGDSQDIAVALTNLGFVALSRGDHAAARSLFEKGLTIQQELGDKRRIAYALEGSAFLAAAQGQLRRAAQLFGSAEALRETIGAPLPPVDRSDYVRMVGIVRSGLSEDALAEAWNAGRAITLEFGIKLALSYG